MNEKPIAVVGAGLVGSLLAIYLEQKGYRVEIFERRDDMRAGNMTGRKVHQSCPLRPGLESFKRCGYFG